MTKLVDCSTCPKCLHSEWQRPRRVHSGACSSCQLRSSTKPSTRLWGDYVASIAFNIFLKPALHYNSIGESHILQRRVRPAAAHMSTKCSVRAANAAERPSKCYPFVHGTSREASRVFSAWLVDSARFEGLMREMQSAEMTREVSLATGNPIRAAFAKPITPYCSYWLQP